MHGEGNQFSKVINLSENQTLTSDYFEKTLSQSTLDAIVASDGITYVLGRAENIF